MAERINLSPRSLQKVYKNFANISCISEVIESRMIRAKMLLVRSDFDVGEISMQCGYRNVEQPFKKHEGCSPSHYRKEHLVQP